VCSATAQRGGKNTKSQAATPGSTVGQVSTVKIDGSCRERERGEERERERETRRNTHGMVKADGSDGAESLQIILVRHIVAVPGHDIKWLRVRGQ
jgi:hypothetical protein